MKYLQKDWYGNACANVGFKIVPSTQWIFKVAVHTAAEKRPLAAANEYKEGLWQQDVAEWFIANPATGRYVECNLSANGAWWLMVFSAPRQRIKLPLPDLKGIMTTSSQQPISWQAELIIPKKLMLGLLGDGAWTYNVCFIVGQEASSKLQRGQTQQYISLNTLTSPEPDFHRPDEFITTLNNI